MSSVAPDWRDPVDFYADHAARFDAERSRALRERPWLDAFLAEVPAGGRVLDLGCGMGEPMAAYMIERGFRVTGIDTTRALLDRAKERLPEGEWIEGDARALDLGRRFNGILAWDSFFHLTIEAQRACFVTFAAHAAPGAALMFNSGGAEGELANPMFGEPLYHASLAPEEYAALLTGHGFELMRHAEDDPACGGRTIWLAKMA